jgi:Dehydrogenases (flavoproteins)
MTIAANGSREYVTCCDILVIGGGPAGTTISALLAQQGWHVEVLEKDYHPRFHIGESLLPYSIPMLEHLGVLPEVEKVGLRKYGAELLSYYDGKTRTLYFSRALDASQPFAYQVRRAEFDQILFRNCAAKGAQVREGVRVRRVEFRPGQTSFVHAEDRQGLDLIWEARFIVDASGRDTFLSSQLGGKQCNPHHNSAAVFSHFEGVHRPTGIDEGNISIAWFDHGWFWVIPFKDGTTSVGAVCWPYYLKTRRTGLDQFLWDTIALCPPIAERMQQAKLLMPAQAAGNYSYRRATMSSEGYILVGDAFAFVDPVFSSGVHLALNSATLGAKVVDAYLRGSPEYPTLRRHFERSVRQGVKTFSWFIYRFTQPAFRHLFMLGHSKFKLEEAVLSVLAGDVFRRARTAVPIFLFKLCYYLTALYHAKSNWSAYQRRRLGVLSPSPSDPWPRCGSQH